MRNDQMRGQHGEAGFTLIEMIIVTTVLAILATIAVPNLIRSTATANESAVMATMRTIAKCQMQFKALDYVDADGNGAFEYSTLKELTATNPLRHSGETLSPPLLSIPMSQLNTEGRLHRHGYFFALFLPDVSGVGLPETAANITNIDARLAADYWTCLAWPYTYNRTGHHTYFVNQQGQTLKALKSSYGGSSSVPPAGAALRGTPSADRIDSQDLAIDETGADGNHWVVVN